MAQEFTTVKREILIKATPERVWNALTIPELRNQWETRSCQIDLAVGGLVELDYGWGVSYRGTIKEIVNVSTLVIVDEENELTIWTLEAHQEGTRVSVEYTGLWSGNLGLVTMENMAYGTYRFMKNMKSVLESDQDIRSTFWKSWIGIHHITSVNDEFTGVEVVQVVPDSPAHGYLQEGDRIFNVNGCDIQGYDEFEELVTSVDTEEPNERLKIALIRNGIINNVELQALPYGVRSSMT